MDSVGEGEGGMVWENDIETCIISYMKREKKRFLWFEKKRKERKMWYEQKEYWPKNKNYKKKINSGS